MSHMAIVCHGLNLLFLLLLFFCCFFYRFEYILKKVDGKWLIWREMPK